MEWLMLLYNTLIKKFVSRQGLAFYSSMSTIYSAIKDKFSFIFSALQNSPHFLSFATLSIALVAASIFLGTALSKIRTPERYVTVKGVAEREVEADLAIWPVVFSEASNDLDLLHERIDKSTALVTEFLLTLKFEQSEIIYSNPIIEDRYAQGYNKHIKFRYRAKTKITLRARNIALVKNALDKSHDLVKKGIKIVYGAQVNPKFIFTDLDSIKPAMIEASIVNARKIADKFAKDSNSKIGKLRHASQGAFTINDTHFPEKKLIKITNSIQYFVLSDK